MVLQCTEEIVELDEQWIRQGLPEYPFAAIIEGEQCLIRLNDFPEEHLYTLLAGDVAVADFDDWPVTWIKAEGKVLLTSAEGFARR